MTEMSPDVPGTPHHKKRGEVLSVILRGDRQTDRERREKERDRERRRQKEREKPFSHPASE